MIIKYLNEYSKSKKVKTFFEQLVSHALFPKNEVTIERWDVLIVIPLSRIVPKFPILIGGHESDS